MSKFQKITSIIAVIFTIVPFLVATVKDSFFNSGCMDGFVIIWLCTALIWIIGAPSAILRLFTLTAKSKSPYARTMTWRVVDAICVFSLIIVAWVTAFIFFGSSPYNLHYIFSHR